MAKNLKELFEEGIVQLAKLPAKNEFDISRLDEFDGYTVPLIKGDYGAGTPVMWNSVYEQLGLNIRNIMVVADPTHTEKILQVFREDEKYLGGGAGKGFKEVIIPYLDKTVPDDVRSVNIIVKQEGKLVGYNTDSQGLLKSVEEALKKEGKTISGGKYVLFGAGGVAQDFVPVLAKANPRQIVIVNRTVKKAVALAAKISDTYQSVDLYGVPELSIRGEILNTLDKPDALINTTDKGNDGKLIDTCIFAHECAENNSLGITNLRNLSKWNPGVVIVDIVQPKKRKSISLRLAEDAGLENLVDGKPMVVYQAVPAYKLVEAAHPTTHQKTLSEKEILEIMREAVKNI